MSDLDEKLKRLMEEAIAPIVEQYIDLQARKTLAEWHAQEGTQPIPDSEDEL